MRLSGSFTRLALAALLFATDGVLAEAAGLQPSRAPEKGCAWKRFESASPKAALLAQECDFGDRKITHAVEGAALVERFSDGGSGDKRVELFSKEAGDSPAV